MSLKEKLRGAVGFPITPFQKDLSLDLAALESNIAFMIQHDFCSLVAAGGTGEIYSMTPAENVDVVGCAVKAVGGKMPVIGGVGYNTAIACGMAREMEKAGADALLVMPPYYVNAPVEGLLEYYTAGRPERGDGPGVCGCRHRRPGLVLPHRHRRPTARSSNRLRRRRARVHVEHLEYRAETFAGHFRCRQQARLHHAQRAAGELCESVVRRARPEARL
ncbi:MAG: dihydrodipicolinate synthase family protein [Candidatus Solibacter usitatus]|nr:dihydrodipicolinate synthase family protein [Candidatus Solibacter usitatus]